METLNIQQIRHYRLGVHHLDRWYAETDALRLAGACGLQNSPPGAAAGALHSRIPGLAPDAVKNMLESEKSLLQAWSYRGAPVVFPTAESDVFLSALVSEPGEQPWIYTRGIGLALDHLAMPFDELLALLVRAIPLLDHTELQSKTTLDQVLAEKMDIPKEKIGQWNSPSPYGSPEKQTVGGAVVSFLLRPCAFLGLVVFAARQGASPTFTSYRRWTGGPLLPRGDCVPRLVRKYLHCYGPATRAGLAAWLGCSPAQAQRMWQTVADELMPVKANGKTRYILAEDRPLFQSPPPAERTLHLLTGHDPYLGLQDRETILADTARQRQVWQTVSNPGVLLWQGGVAGTWKPRKTGRALEMHLTLWDGAPVPGQALHELCERYAAARQCRLAAVLIDR